MTTRAHRLRLCLLAGAALGWAGCAGVADTGRYAVVSPKAPFYKYGPAQAFGADFALTRGQKVTMVERGFGFSRVMTDDGLTGYISTDDVTPAPDPVPPAPPRVAARRGGSLNPRKKPASRPEPDAGLFNVNDVPLPTDPDPPKPADVVPPKAEPRPHAR